MNWNLGNLSLVDGMLYADERFLGNFSCHQAGLEALALKRGVIDTTWYMSPSDHDLMEAIDADEP